MFKKNRQVSSFGLGWKFSFSAICLKKVLCVLVVTKRFIVGGTIFIT